MALKFYTQQDIMDDQKFYNKISKVYSLINDAKCCLGGTSLGTLQPTLLLTEKSLVFFNPFISKTTVQTYPLNTITDIKKSKGFISNIIIELLKVENIEFKISASTADIDQMITKIQDFIYNAMKEVSSLEMQQQILNAQQVDLQRQQLEELKKAEANKVHCPKCKSTSITTTNKKISAGKGLVGAVVGSMINPVGTAVGAGVGAMSSKKNYCICMNCGHKWKL